MAGSSACVRIVPPKRRAHCVQEPFAGVIGQAVVEQSGPVRAVVWLEGKHESAEPARAWLPFTLRLCFYAGSEAVRLMHSFVFDGG